MSNRNLTDEDVAAIAVAVKDVHVCRFDETEAKALHRFAQSVDDGGIDRWNAILDFGGTLIQIKRAGIVAVVGLIIISVFGAIWAGFRVKIGG